MDSHSQLTANVNAKVTQGKISIDSAAKLLNKSRRTIEPVNNPPDSLKKQVQQLIQTKYFDFNLQHLVELLTVNEGLTIKRETLRKWTYAIHHVKRAKRRRSRVRKYREQMEQSGLMLQMDGSPHESHEGVY